ncbi:methionyl-tRNA formyltransferase [Ectopseudomonas composti]|jgi:methionyl-tRNA formyltransferase|uniref:methionyl-tRNA formyltransferase n=1 Tax=Ectopseudomonas composti TaxID=658457 RepID=UPI0009EAEF8F|nr:formyltransferase family protein [Pseudomonas composti]
MTLKVLVLCSLETGWDSVVSVAQQGAHIAAVIGLDHDSCDQDKVSGVFDVEKSCQKLGVSFIKVKDYSLRAREDKLAISAVSYDLIWVAGWQRLVPEWLIESARMGVLGVHGSPDGISGGRGRSPQNWALLLGCTRFDIALFLIRKGVDDGPVILERSFFYNESDDIRSSYYKASLLISEMVLEVLNHPGRLCSARPQSGDSFYFPQRLPDDGRVDWFQPVSVIARHCRALTRPYPGIRTKCNGIVLRVWQCQPFDDRMNGAVGQISTVFADGCFLVNCADGRLLVREWSSDDAQWEPFANMLLESVPFLDQLSRVVERHTEKFPDQPVSDRICRLVI